MLAALSLAVLFLSQYIPPLQLLGSFLLPVPVVLVSMRRGGGTGVMTVVTVCLLSSLFFGILQGVSLFLILMSGGVLLGFLIRKKVSPTGAVLGSGVGVLLATLATVLLFNLFLKQDLLKMTREGMRESQEMTLKISSSLNLPREEILKQQEMGKRMEKLFAIIVPGMIVASAAMIAFVNFLVSRVILLRLGYQMESFPPFSCWRAPWPVAVIWLSGGILCSSQVALLRDSGTNIFFLGGLWFLIQGGAVAWYFLLRHFQSRLARGALLWLALTVFGNFVSLLGAVDSWMNLRKLSRKAV